MTALKKQYSKSPIYEVANFQRSDCAPGSSKQPDPGALTSAVSETAAHPLSPVAGDPPAPPSPTPPPSSVSTPPACSLSVSPWMPAVGCTAVLFKVLSCKI